MPLHEAHNFWNNETQPNQRDFLCSRLMCARQDWTKMAEEKYSETARILQVGNTSQQGPGKGKGQLRIQPGDKELLECLESPEKRRANQVSFREGHNPAEGEGTGYPHTRGVSLGTKPGYQCNACLCFALHFANVLLPGHLHALTVVKWWCASSVAQWHTCVCN